MKPVDFFIIGILVLIVLGAGFAIYRSKKSGKKCIGCPDSGSCSGKCSDCNGNCSCGEK